jgi:hypothetical protein
MPWDVQAFIVPAWRLTRAAGASVMGRLLRRHPRPRVVHGAEGRGLLRLAGAEEPLPQDAHDIAMDWIVTDTRVIDCAANRRRSQNLGVRSFAFNS